MNFEVINLMSLLNPRTLVYLVVFTFLGIVVGALPGLTATMAVSILVSITYGMKGADAIVILVAVFLGGIYGGSRSAILLNVPGTPSSAATALDGFPLAKKGLGGRVGIVVTTMSALGGIIGLIILAVSTNLIARFALKFGFWEYFWLAMMGVLISASITAGDAAPKYKGMITGFLGMMIALVGLDFIHGLPRLTFGIRQLNGGINLVPAMIGLFGLAEALDSLKDPESHKIEKVNNKESLPSLWKESFKDINRYPKTFFMSAIIGTFIGALPGVGPDIASWVAYGNAKRGSKHPEEFGKGAMEGVIASETANNAATSGVFIPLLTLGIPGDAVSAIILGGIQMHGYMPGPTFFFENPDFVYFLAVILLLVNVVMWLEGSLLTGLLAKVLRAPVGVIMPLVIVLCVIGSYMINLRKFDIILMLVFGLAGLVMRRLHLPAAPMALGIILGSLADQNFRRGLVAGRYSFVPFFSRGLSIVLYVILAICIIWPKVAPIIRAKLKAKKNA